MKVIVFTDGGSRGNPGLAAGAYFVYDEHHSVIFSEGKFLGTRTNNDAEYEAFLASAEWVRANVQVQKIDKIEWKLDSLLVVEQLNKHWKIKEARMLVLAQQIWQILNSLQIPYSISHVPRAQNAAADALVNQTLDQQSA